MEFAQSVAQVCGARDARPGDSESRTSAKLQQSDVEKWGLQGVQLRPYQLEGVSWLAECYDRGHGCILGDEMGLGKTVQVDLFMSHTFQ